MLGILDLELVRRLLAIHNRGRVVFLSTTGERRKVVTREMLAKGNFNLLTRRQSYATSFLRVF